MPLGVPVMVMIRSVAPGRRSSITISHDDCALRQCGHNRSNTVQWMARVTHLIWCILLPFLPRMASAYCGQRQTLITFLWPPVAPPPLHSYLVRDGHLLGGLLWLLGNGWWLLSGRGPVLGGARVCRLRTLSHGWWRHVPLRGASS